MTKRDKQMAIFLVFCILVGVIAVGFLCWPATPEEMPPTVTTQQPNTTYTPMSSPTKSPLPEGFADVLDYVPDAGVVLSYYTGDNFIGRRVKGYEANRAILTVEACEALKKAADILREQGYRIYIFDAYRPADAVKDFVEWGQDEEDTLRKEDFYPTLTKEQLFSQYISSNSKHSWGSTIDLTIMREDGSEVLMGCHFDYFHPLAHTFTDLVSSDIRENRMILRRAMEAAGFEGSSSEWWHFHLIDEPYPNRAFNFYVQ